MRVLTFVVFFILLIACSNPFKAPYNENQDLKKWIHMTEEKIKKEHWQEAKNTQHLMRKGWADMRNRVALNASSDDLTELEISMEQLMTYIEEKEKVLALAEVGKLKQLWEGIARL